MVVGTVLCRIVLLLVVSPALLSAAAPTQNAQDNPYAYVGPPPHRPVVPPAVYTSKSPEWTQDTAATSLKAPPPTEAGTSPGQHLGRNIAVDQPKGGRAILGAPTNSDGQIDETAHIDIQPWGDENATHLAPDPGTNSQEMKRAVPIMGHYGGKDHLDIGPFLPKDVVEKEEPSSAENQSPPPPPSIPSRSRQVTTDKDTTSGSGTSGHESTSKQTAVGQEKAKQLPELKDDERLNMPSQERQLKSDHKETENVRRKAGLPLNLPELPELKDDEQLMPSQGRHHKSYHKYHKEAENVRSTQNQNGTAEAAAELPNVANNNATRDMADLLHSNITDHHNRISQVESQVQELTDHQDEILKLAKNAHSTALMAHQAVNPDNMTIIFTNVTDPLTSGNNLSNKSVFSQILENEQMKKLLNTGSNLTMVIPIMHDMSSIKGIKTGTQSGEGKGNTFNASQTQVVPIMHSVIKGQSPILPSSNPFMIRAIKKANNEAAEEVNTPKQPEPKDEQKPNPTEEITSNPESTKIEQRNLMVNRKLQKGELEGKENVRPAPLNPGHDGTSGQGLNNPESQTHTKEGSADGKEEKADKKSAKRNSPFVIATPDPLNPVLETDSESPSNSKAKAKHHFGNLRSNQLNPDNKTDGELAEGPSISESITDTEKEGALTQEELDAKAKNYFEKVQFTPLNHDNLNGPPEESERPREDASNAGTEHVTKMPENEIAAMDYYDYYEQETPDKVDVNGKNQNHSKPGTQENIQKIVLGDPSGKPKEEAKMVDLSLTEENNKKNKDGINVNQTASTDSPLEVQKDKELFDKNIDLSNKPVLDPTGPNPSNVMAKHYFEHKQSTNRTEMYHNPKIVLTSSDTPQEERQQQSRLTKQRPQQPDQYLYRYPKTEMPSRAELQEYNLQTSATTPPAQYESTSGPSFSMERPMETTISNPYVTKGPEWKTPDWKRQEKETSTSNRAATKLPDWKKELYGTNPNWNQHKKPYLYQELKPSTASQVPTKTENSQEKTASTSVKQSNGIGSNDVSSVLKQTKTTSHGSMEQKITAAPSLAAAKALGLETLVKLKEKIVAQGIRDELKGSMSEHNWLIENHGKQTIILLR